MTTARQTLRETEWWKRIPTLDDIKYEPIEWVVDQMIPRGAFVLWAGKPASYKSSLALDLARAVSKGEQFAQFKTAPGVEVMYIDLENGRNLIAHRKKILQIGATPNLRYWGRWASLPFVGLHSSELLAYADQVRPLLIFDSLVRFHRANENDNSEMAPVMDAFVQLGRKGATVVVRHHQGKDGDKNSRGAMEIEAAPDLAYRVDRVDCVVTLTQFKNRLDRERTFELRLTEFGFESADHVQNSDRGYV